jgi:eukaryotic-like serine/threonine-protein kinase
MTNHHQRTPPDVPGYEITRLIGLGGMGEVYLARQQALNRPVAIKFLSRNAGEPPDEYDLRFRREAELMARVSHPNVVTIFDYGTAAGRPYLVMEYVEDGDLRSRMIPDAPMKVAEILAITGPVIRAIQYLHRQGIIHRDLKPENILIHHEETPKVTDFGLAVLDFAIGSPTRVDRAMGTPGYVSPEQQYGLRVDERADQFSLAALCYEMATGRKPLGAYQPPSRLNPKLSREADAAIRRGLSEDPEDRFATIGEFGEALERGLSATADRSGRGRLALLAVALALASLTAAGLYLGGIVPGKVPARVQELPRKLPARVQGPTRPAPARDLPRRLRADPVKMDLVLIPEGEFLMGSLESDPAATATERPVHRVRITRPFYLGEKEVTVGQFREFVEQTDYKTTAELNGNVGYIYNNPARQIEQRPDLNWRNPGLKKTQGEDEPVVQVSWDDAVAFCDWLSKVEGRAYRLPTEAEWEYACRAETTTRWSCGEDPEALKRYAWYKANSNYETHAVGTKEPNRFGLFDMHGNVSEWCSDFFGEYGHAPAVDPVGPLEGRNRVIRGGTARDEPIKTSSATRRQFAQNKPYYVYGFRVCSTATP